MEDMHNGRHLHVPVVVSGAVCGCYENILELASEKPYRSSKLPILFGLRPVLTLLIPNMPCSCGCASLKNSRWEVRHNGGDLHVPVVVSGAVCACYENILVIIETIQVVRVTHFSWIVSGPYTSDPHYALLVWVCQFEELQMGGHA